MTKKIFLFIVSLSLCFYLLSCVGGSGKKRNTKKRQPAGTQLERGISTGEEQPEAGGPEGPATPTKEELLFPIVINKKHKTVVINVEDDNHQKMKIFARPTSHPMIVTAGLSGEVSIQPNKEDPSMQTIVITSTHNRVIYYNVSANPKHSTIVVTNGQKVKQEQSLVTTVSPVVYSIQENGQLQTVCMQIVNSTATQNKVKKQFEDHPTCSSNANAGNA